MAGQLYPHISLNNGIGTGRHIHYRNHVKIKSLQVYNPRPQAPVTVARCRLLPYGSIGGGRLSTNIASSPTYREGSQK